MLFGSMLCCTGKPFLLLTERIAAMIVLNKILYRLSKVTFQEMTYILKRSFEYKII